MKSNSFFASVVRIAIPVGFQSMLQSSFAMIDQLMVGQLGSGAVAAIEAAGRPAFIYSVMSGAAAAVAGIMIAQYLGMGDKKRADQSLSVNLTAVLLLAAVFLAVCLSFPGRIIRIFIEDEPSILALGQDYLVRIVWTCLPLGASSILSVMIRCMDRAALPLFAGISAAVINTALNYALIFGHFGFPSLGIAGAAIASVISQAVHFALIAVMFLHVRGCRFSFSLSLGRTGWRQFIQILLPALVSEFLWSAGQSVNTFLYGHISTGALAAMSMTGPVQGLFIGAMSGVSQAAGILIGKRLGAKEYGPARQDAQKLLGYGFAGSLVLSAVLIGLRTPYVQLYNVEPEVRTAAAWLLFLFAVLAPLKVANMILGGGIIRSGGKTAYVMAIDIIGTWFIGVPLGLVSAFVLQLPVTWVYFILSQEELIRLLLSLFIFRRGTWMGKLS